MSVRQLRRVLPALAGGFLVVTGVLAALGFDAAVRRQAAVHELFSESEPVPDDAAPSGTSSGAATGLWSHVERFATECGPLTQVSVIASGSHDSSDVRVAELAALATDDAPHRFATPRLVQRDFPAACAGQVEAFLGPGDREQDLPRSLVAAPDELMTLAVVRSSSTAPPEGHTPMLVPTGRSGAGLEVLALGLAVFTVPVVSLTGGAVRTVVREYAGDVAVRRVAGFASPVAAAWWLMLRLLGAVSAGAAVAVLVWSLGVRATESVALGGFEVWTVDLQPAGFGLTAAAVVTVCWFAVVGALPIHRASVRMLPAEVDPAPREAMHPLVSIGWLLAALFVMRAGADHSTATGHVMVAAGLAAMAVAVVLVGRMVVAATGSVWHRRHELSPAAAYLRRRSAAAFSPLASLAVALLVVSFVGSADFSAASVDPSGYTVEISDTLGRLDDDRDVGALATTAGATFIAVDGHHALVTDPLRDRAVEATVWSLPCADLIAVAELRGGCRGGRLYEVGRGATFDEGDSLRVAPATVGFPSGAPSAETGLVGDYTAGGEVRAAWLSTGEFVLAGVPESTADRQLFLVDAPNVNSLIAAASPLHRLEGVDVATPAARRAVEHGVDAMAESFLGAMAALALAVGAYAMVLALYLRIAESRRELAVYRLLGARRAQVAGTVVAQFLVPMWVGVVVALASGWALARAYSHSGTNGMLPAVSPLFLGVLLGMSILGSAVLGIAAGRTAARPPGASTR